MYQFSLKAFSVVFHVAIEVYPYILIQHLYGLKLQRAAMDKDVAKRVQNLTDSITFMVFQYTTRGLFECDKLIFTAQMTFQVLLMNKEINPTELDFLLRFPSAPNTTSPVDFISNVGWGAIKTLVMMNGFLNLDKDIESQSKRWRSFVDAEVPEKEKFPHEWKKKNGLQKLCIMRYY